MCSEEQQNVVVCEDAGELTIDCLEGTIVMQDANYGRTRPDSEVCPFKRNHNDATDCIDVSTTRRMNAECNGKHSCSVPATNDFFGDPCPGTYKYIEATYRCQCGEEKRKSLTFFTSYSCFFSYIRRTRPVPEQPVSHGPV